MDEPVRDQSYGYYSVGSGTSFLFTAIYGLHSIAARGPLWTILRRLEAQINKSWLVIEGFNTILSMKIGRLTVHYRSMKLETSGILQQTVICLNCLQWKGTSDGPFIFRSLPS